MARDEQRALAGGGVEALGQAVERAQVAMVLCDARLADLPMTYVNGAFEAMTQYGRDFALGRNCRFLQGPETDPADVESIRTGLRAQDEVQVTLTNHRADGSTFRNQLLISPIHDENGALIAYFGVLREVHDTGPSAEGADDASIGLLRELQHRVKNHLAMVVSMIRTQAMREVTADSLRGISRRVEALALLYEEMLKGNGEGAGKRRIAAGPYLDRIASVLSSLESRDAIRTNVEHDEIELTVDQAALLGLLLSEFLTNALEHAFEGREQGVVEVSLRREGDRVRLTVEDDGSGMPEGTGWPFAAPSIETQHRRAEDEEGRLVTTARDGEAGVGGSIVAALSRSLGADLRVERPSRGGTRVTVEFAP